MKPLFLLLLMIYKMMISPMLGRNCRFYPPCSTYAMIVLKGNRSLLNGLLLITRRVLRCNPWSYGGYDPPPDM